MKKFRWSILYWEEKKQNLQCMETQSGIFVYILRILLLYTLVAHFMHIYTMVCCQMAHSTHDIHSWGTLRYSHQYATNQTAKNPIQTIINFFWKSNFIRHKSPILNFLKLGEIPDIINFLSFFHKKWLISTFSDRYVFQLKKLTKNQFRLKFQYIIQIVPFFPIFFLSNYFSSISKYISKTELP